MDERQSGRQVFLTIGNDLRSGRRETTNAAARGAHLRSERSHPVLIPKIVGCLSGRCVPDVFTVGFAVNRRNLGDTVLRNIGQCRLAWRIASGIGPWPKEQFRVGVVSEHRTRVVSCRNEIAERCCLGLAEGSGATVRVIVSVRRGAAVEAPLESVVPVQINAKRPVPVITPILSPVPVTGGICGIGIPIRVQHGNDPDLQIVHTGLESGICCVVREEIFGETQRHLSRQPLPRMMHSDEHHVALRRVVDTRVRGDLDSLYRATLDRSPNCEHL